MKLVSENDNEGGAVDVDSDDPDMMPMPKASVTKGADEKSGQEKGENCDG